MANCIPDLEIGQQISSILHRDVRINDDGIHVCVQDGWVFLDGKVDFEDERSGRITD
jgi:osmotically-inducible protein OsmY